MQQAIKYIHRSLNEKYADNELYGITNRIISAICGFSFTEIILNKNTKFSDNQREILRKFVEELKTDKPIQYVLGETEFCGLPFLVNPSVLIPRPETEELVEWIVSTLISNESYHILDIGTGSGCIAVALKHMLPKSVITAFDISEVALQTADKNSHLNKCKVKFEKVDILNTPFFRQKWDIIVSNPPYIPELEKTEIKPNVLNFEPHNALFVPTENPMIFYEAIASFANKQLEEGGKIFMEIHKDFANEAKEILKKENFCDISIKNDISGNQRMVQATKQNSKLNV